MRYKLRKNAMKKLSCFVVIVIVMFCNNALFSKDDSFVSPQEKELRSQIDSLLNLSWSLAREKPMESIAMLGQIEELHTQQDTAYKADVVYYYYGVFYKNLNRYEESEQHFNKYEAYHQERNNKPNLAAVYMVKANLYSDKGDLAKSTEAASKSLQLSEELNDTVGMMTAGSKLGYLHSEIGNFDEALTYHNRSNRLALLTGDSIQTSISYTNIALVYEKRKMLDSALVAFSKAYAIDENMDAAYAKILSRYNMGNVLNKMSNSEAAEPYILACISLADSIDIPALRIASRWLLADLQLTKGEIDSAIATLDSLDDKLDYALGLKQQMEVFGLRAKAYSQKGDFETAFDHHQTFKELSDSLLGLESRNQINELEVRYQSEKQKQQIAFLDLENKTSMALIRQKDRTILIGAIGLVMITVFSIILFLLIRKNIRQQKALSKALADKDLLLREIHHRVKNNLQIVSSLLSLQGRSTDDETALKAINAGKSRVRSMALIHQSLYQRENLTGVNVQEYMRKLCSELFHTYNIDETQVSLKLNIDPLELDVDTLVPLGLIVNELITNSLKYAFPADRSGTLSINLTNPGNILLLEIEDDGVGYDEKKVRSGAFGRKLVQSLVKQLEGILTVKSNNGTHIRLEIHKFKSSATEI